MEVLPGSVARQLRSQMWFRVMCVWCIVADLPGTGGQPDVSGGEGCLGWVIQVFFLNGYPVPRWVLLREEGKEG